MDERWLAPDRDRLRRKRRGLVAELEKWRGRIAELLPWHLGTPMQMRPSYGMVALLLWQPWRFETAHRGLKLGVHYELRQWWSLP